MISVTDENPDRCIIPFGRLVAALFLHRDNRFRVQVQVDEQIVTAHLPKRAGLANYLYPAVRSGQVRPTRLPSAGGAPLIAWPWLNMPAGWCR